jgi:5'-methylthioadenosine phosphorylase
MDKTIPTIGLIGGSGFDQIDGLENAQLVDLDTPMGKPSDSILIGNLGNVKVAFLPRHGRGHFITPTEIPTKANILAFKQLGVDRIISISAVGSLREDIVPGSLVVPDQLIDRTRLRDNTFFGSGIVAHISFADPFCPWLSTHLLRCAKDIGAAVHEGGTYLVMEGPAFSTRAESRLYQTWGASIIGMTALPEAKLAREAEICYATLASVTDFDSWRESEPGVSVDAVIETLNSTLEICKLTIRELVQKLPIENSCECTNALARAIATRSDVIPKDVRAQLAPILKKYTLGPND